LRVLGAPDRGFVARCDGHPMTLRATAFTLRERPGTSPDTLPDTAPHAILEVLVRLGRPAREVVRLGGVLAPAPIPPEVARGAVDPAGFETAVEELAAQGFATWVDGNVWLQALAVEVACGAFGKPGADRAAEAVLTALTDSGASTGNQTAAGRHHLLLQHARVLADHSAAHRVALLRPLAAAHEAHGDPAAAGEIHAVVLSTGEAACADFTAAARVELACGLDAEALGHARQALVLTPGDHEAALVAAQALDSQGAYAEADRTFWHTHLPTTGEERHHAAKARRLRGHPREAVALLEPALAGPGPIRDDLTLEYARNLLQAGQPKRAGDVAAGIEDCPDAQVIQAEAALAGEEPAGLETTYTHRYGSESPLTLTASVHAGRALLAGGQPRQALEKLAGIERIVRRVLGDDHLLHLRIRHGMGLAHARLRAFDRQADLLEGIREPQIRLLGRTHPETLETRLDLGLALALGGRGPLERATALVDDATRDAESAPGVSPALAAKARAAKQVVRLPEPFVSALHALERLVWP
jgi:tetratricopeptide (TPR) repeat protein